MNRETLWAIIDSKEDARPWQRLSRMDLSQLVEFHFNDADEATHFSNEIKADGAEVKVLGMVALSANGPDIWLVVLKLIENPVAAWTTLQIVEKLGKAVWFMVSKARARGLPLRCGPAFQMELVKTFLDKRFGAARWHYDPERVMVKEIGTTTILKLTEEVSQLRLILEVNGDEVHELTRRDA
jgi:hypothetical protein